MPLTSASNSKVSFDQASGYTVDYAGTQANVIGGTTNALHHKGFAAVPPTTLSSIGEVFAVDAPTYVSAVYPVDPTVPAKDITYVEE
jgi:hypothetical protein